MKIRIIVPILRDDWNTEILREYKMRASPGTEIDVVNIEKGAESIESEYDEELAAPSVLQQVENAGLDAVDGIIIFCFGDVAVHAAREIVTIPVVGLGECSQLLALLIGDRFSILSTISNAVPRIARKVRAMGLESRLASIRPLNLPVLTKDKESFKKALLSSGTRAVEDGADVIILGCGTYFGVEKWLEEQLKVPVISCALAALKVIELLVQMNISHSKRAFPNPPEKKRILG